jgi:predicted metalloprotease
MRWTPGGDSSDVEDRRDETGGGGGGGFGFGGIHLGIGGFLLLLVLSLVFKQNFFALLGGGGAAPGPAAVSSGPHTGAPNTAKDEQEKPTVEFVTFVLNDTQKTWTEILPEQTGKQYRHAKLVLYRDYTTGGCGAAQAATGPFYCPEDEKVYIDLGFYDELSRRFGAPGDFAKAYVLAHEIGHHVQKILGIEQKAQQFQESNPGQANATSVKLELQADCFAGVWAHSTQERNLLEAGDIPSALGAAAAVGDDRLQKMTRGRVQPETFTHGTSQQRQYWFQQGFNGGTVASCNTFQ